MPRLLIVATVPDMVRAFLLPHARHFRERGWEVDAAARGVEADAACVRAFDRVWDVAWSRNPLDPLNLWRAPRRIRELARRRRYDLIHTHTPVASFVTRFALRRFRRQGRPKVLYTAHGFHFYEGGRPLKNAAFRHLERLAGRWTDYLVVLNHDDEEAARRFSLVPCERLRCIPGVGVDTALYSPETVPPAEVARVRRELGLAPGDPLLLMIAEFNPGKRHRDAVAAFARIHHSRAHLALAGSGRLQDQTRRLVDDLGLTRRVHLLGYRADIPALVRASAATVLPSEREGLPRSVMESLSLAVPVIGTDVRGIRDLLSQGGGALVRVGDVQGLAAAMAWVLDHPEEAREMGRRGRRHMAAFDLKRVLALYEQLYAEALGGAPLPLGLGADHPSSQETSQGHASSAF